MEQETKRKAQESEDEGVKALLDEIDEKHDLSTLSKSAGGKLLLETLSKDLVLSLDRLASNYKTMTHIEMIASCASLYNSLNMHRAISRATTQKETLEKILETALD